MAVAKRKKWTWIRKGKVARGRKSEWIISKQKLTYHLRKTDGSGEMNGRDNDPIHPKGTTGKKDKTQVPHNYLGQVGGRLPEDKYVSVKDEKGVVIGYRKVKQ
jgi:hypothetical protein